MLTPYKSHFPLHTLRSSALPTPKWFRETVPPDLEELRGPFSFPRNFFKTPTQRNPQGLLDDTENTPRQSTSTLSRMLSIRNSFQRQSFSLTREKVAALNRLSDRQARQPSLGSGLQLFHESMFAVPPPAPLVPPELHVGTTGIEGWRSTVQPFADDTYLTESPTLSSPVRTLSISSRRSSLYVFRFSIIIFQRSDP